MRNSGRAISVGGAYVFIIGIVTLFPSLASGLFGVEIRDRALLLAYSGVLLAAGILMWSIGRNAGTYAGLVPPVALFFVIHFVTFAYLWGTGLWTIRTAAVPIVVNGALAIWIWSTRPRKA